MANNLNRRAREQRLRRIARRYNLRLEKSRIRTPQAKGYDRYRLFDVQRNAVVYGGIPDEYSTTLDEIERFLTQPLL